MAAAVTAGKHGPWKEEWGEKPEGGGRGLMYPYLDKKAAEEGIYQRMDDILSGPANEFTVELAYQEMLRRDQEIEAELKKVRDHYLQGATPADFDTFDAAFHYHGSAKTFLLILCNLCFLWQKLHEPSYSRRCPPIGGASFWLNFFTGWHRGGSVEG